MADQPRNLEVLFEHVGKLPPRAQLALLARCAFRIAPGMLPKEFIDTDRITRAIGALEVCATTTALCALRPGKEISLIARAAAKASLEASGLGSQPFSEEVWQSTYAAAAVAAEFSEKLRTENLQVCLRYYKNVIDYVFGESKFNQDAVWWDVVFLRERSQLLVGKETQIPLLEFLSRPLWNAEGQIPQKWDRVLQQWNTILHSLTFPTPAQRYWRMCQGMDISWDEGEERILHWAEGSGDPEAKEAAAVLKVRWQLSLPSPAPPISPPPPVAGKPAEFAAPPSAEAAPEDISTEGIPFVPEQQARKGPPPGSPGKPLPPPPLPPPPGTLPPVQTPAPPELPPGPWMHNDRALTAQEEDQDAFGYQDYAEAIAGVLDNEDTNGPFTMAINAPWGAGKTTLANWIETRLRQRSKDRGPEHIVLRFNAWKHDDAASLAAPFIAAVSREANRHRDPLLRLFQPLPWKLHPPFIQRRRRIILGSILLGAVVVGGWFLTVHLNHVDAQKQAEAAREESISVTTTDTKNPQGAIVSSAKSETAPEKRPKKQPQPPATLPAQDPMDKWLDSLEMTLTRLAAFLGVILTATGAVLGALAKYGPSLFSFPRSLAEFVASPKKSNSAATMEEVRKDLEGLIDEATMRGNRFFVFIDDIERCRPPRSIDILEAINQLLDHPRVYVVLLGDMAAVAASAQLKYKDLAKIYVPSSGQTLSGADTKEAFGRLYLQKMIQFQFDLPPLTNRQVQKYVKEMMG